MRPRYDRAMADLQREDDQWADQMAAGEDYDFVVSQQDGWDVVAAD